MRFTLIKDLQKERAMVMSINILLLFTLLYLVSDIVVKAENFGITLSTLHTTLFGNTDEFIDPITRAAFLEHLHGEIFFMMMILLTLSAVFVRVSKKNSFSLWVVNLNLISVLLSLIALAVGYFYLRSFLAMYLATFFSWHILSFFMSLYALWRLNAAKI